MNARPPVDATQVLAEHQGGDPHAASRLLPLVYAELRALAGAYMRRERPDHTLQPTALVHEAYLRLIDITPRGLAREEPLRRDGGDPDAESAR